jgi:hypothetical protein
MQASPIRAVAAALLVCLFPRGTACRSAYNAHPKLVAVIVIDPLQGDYTEEGAENAVGRGPEDAGPRGYYSRSQPAWDAVPDTVLGRKFLNRPEGGWYVMAVPMPYAVGSTSGTDHALPYSDDTHAPLAFYGLVFHPGTYRSPAEPVGLAVTLVSLLDVNAPRNVTGRVPTEAVATSEAPLRSQEDQAQAAAKYVQPASRNLPQGDD